MLEEIQVMSSDVTFAINALEDEINARILNGDGEIEQLQRIVDALGNADRILIV